MKALVIGAGGLLGQELCRALAAAGWEAVPAACDLTRPAQVLAAARDLGPDAVVNCGAWTEVDACEADPDRAFAVNALGARNAALAARRVGAKVLQVSTDYVFAGDRIGPYREFDPTGPRSVYGASKEAGERLVREQTPDHFIVRTAWLYGDSDRCFPAAIRRLAGQRAGSGEPLRVVDDQRGTPTWSRDLAAQLAALLPTEAFGTCHAAAHGETTWFGFARAVVAGLGLDVAVEPCASAEFPRPAARPANSVLDNRCLRLEGLDRMRPWEEAWREFAETSEYWQRGGTAT